MRLWLAFLLFLGLVSCALSATTVATAEEEPGAEETAPEEPAGEGEPDAEGSPAPEEEGKAAEEGEAEEKTTKAAEGDGDSGATSAVLSFISLASGVAFAMVL